MKFSKYHALGNDLLKNSPSVRETKGLNEACQPLKIPPPLEGGAWGGGKIFK